MANIEKKKYDELGYNSKRIISVVDQAIDGGPLPILVYNLDVTVDDMVDAMKYIIDTGWLSSGKTYARKVEYTNQYKEYETGVFITHDETDFDRYEQAGYYYFPKDYPVVIATDHIYKDTSSKNFNTYIHNGDINLKIRGGIILTKDEWDSSYAHRGNAK